jgi:hypothetical protein
MARPMLADSGDARHSLEPLGERFAGHAIMYANDLHNAMPASGAQVGSTPSEGFLGRAVALDVLRRFCCRVWVHTPGKPFVHHPKVAPCARPGRFLGFERPMGSGAFRVLLESGQITKSQSVVFADTPQPRLPAPSLPAPSPVPPPLVYMRVSRSWMMMTVMTRLTCALLLHLLSDHWPLDYLCSRPQAVMMGVLTRTYCTL